MSQNICDKDVRRNWLRKVSNSVMITCIFMVQCSVQGFSTLKQTSRHPDYWWGQSLVEVEPLRQYLIHTLRPTHVHGGLSPCKARCQGCQDKWKTSDNRLGCGSFMTPFCILIVLSFPAGLGGGWWKDFEIDMKFSSLSQGNNTDTWKSKRLFLTQGALDCVASVYRIATCNWHNRTRPTNRWLMHNRLLITLGDILFEQEQHILIAF